MGGGPSRFLLYLSPHLSLPHIPLSVVLRHLSQDGSLPQLSKDDGMPHLSKDSGLPQPLIHSPQDFLFAIKMPELPNRAFVFVTYLESKSLLFNLKVCKTMTLVSPQSVVPPPSLVLNSCLICQR